MGLQGFDKALDCGENARFIGAFTVSVLGERHPVTRWYDDGFGPLWVYRDAGGLLAVIRAKSWEDAWSICEDEVFDDARCECPLMWKGHGEPEPDPTRVSEDCPIHFDFGDDGLPERYGYRPNGNGHHAWNKTGIYCEDQNGSYLEPLTAELLERLRLIVSWQSWEDE